MGLVNIDYVDFSKSRLPALHRVGLLPQFSNTEHIPISIANRFFISQSRAWSENTVRTYAEHLLCFLNWLAKGDIQIQDCDHHTLLVFADTLCQNQGRGEGLSWNTVHRRVRLAGFFLHWCAKNGYLHLDPSAVILTSRDARRSFTRAGYSRRSFSKPVRYVELPIAVKLIKSLEESSSQHAVRNSLIGSLMLECGLRITEALSIQLQDLPACHEDQRFALCTVMGKGRKERLIAIPQRLLRNLHAYSNTERQFVYERLTMKRKLLAKQLFLTSTGASPSRSWIEKIFLQVSMNIWGRITPHMLRHTFGTYHYHIHKDLVLLSQLMGHAQLTTTEKFYVQTAVLSGFSEEFSALINELNN